MAGTLAALSTLLVLVLLPMLLLLLGKLSSSGT